MKLNKCLICCYVVLVVSTTLKMVFSRCKFSDNSVQVLGSMHPLLYFLLIVLCRRHRRCRPRCVRSIFCRVGSGQNFSMQLILVFIIERFSGCNSTFLSFYKLCTLSGNWLQSVINSVIRKESGIRDQRFRQIGSRLS